MATRRSAKAQKLDDLAGQPDAKAPLDWQLFLKSAQPVLKILNDDLRARAKTSASVAEALKARHAAERDAKRTADSFVEWQDHFIEQVAAAWLLSCVFVRTLEDRGLLGHNRLAGPGAADSLKLFLELAPSLNERDYLLTIFRELTRFPSTKELFDSCHNPVWLLTPSAEGAKALVQLFQQPRAEVPAFRFGQSDTGFLGWLYQDLDAGVRERFALLQTPRFVESFILDRTLEPAIEKFGLDDTTLIDPTCGSGHFLLGAFERLFDHRLRKEPGLSTREAAKKALDAVFGSDINPYAVGIARFRLTLAFLDKAGFASLRTAPALPLHVVVGDSLLHNPHVSQPDFADLAPSTKGWRGEEFALEDEAAARDVLHRKYAAVVGNPPYITVKDAVLREEYRKMYPRAAAGKYSIAAPFTERFFQLGRQGARIGMITANSFMKREFGKKLIEQSLPAVNLDLVINTSGAYIPGHGTPTVLLFGGAEAPKGTQVTTVLASRGEPTTPEDPEQGLVWRSIADHWSEVGFENEFISVATTERASLAKHPWSLGGGGAAELKEMLEERGERRLGDVVQAIGFASFPASDDVFMLDLASQRRLGIPAELGRELIVGENVRDWTFSATGAAIVPYDTQTQTLLPLSNLGGAAKHFWRYRAVVDGIGSFGGKTRKDDGTPPWAWYRWIAERIGARTKLSFAAIATHNHFALDRGGRVYNNKAPVILLPDTATEDDHLALLAYLNSSTASFYFRQVCHNKGQGGVNEGLRSDVWDQFLEFSGSNVEKLPVLPASTRAADLAKQMIAAVGAFRAASDVPAIAEDILGDRLDLRLREQSANAKLAEMTALQEQLDWLWYEQLGLASPVGVEAPLALAPGARPFEVLLAEKDTRGAANEWTRRNRIDPPDIVLARTTTAVRAWVDARVQQIRTSRDLALLESPEFKRPWRPVDWPKVLAAANDLAMETAAEDSVRPAIATLTLKSVQHSRPALPGDQLRQALERCAVPFLASLRFTDGGLDRYVEWERTWDLQRREDAGEKIEHIPVPPKYGQGDYRSTTSWQLRGPLDVPKERFISYPGCESDQDGEPVYGWAGWDHEQRARALATLYVNRRDEESWTKDRLTPMLAGLLELLPWLKQWHGTPSDDYAGVSPGAYYEGFLDDECRKHGLTRDDLRAWRPAEKKRGKKATATVAPADDAGEPTAPKKRGRKKKSADETQEEEGAAE